MCSGHGSKQKSRPLQDYLTKEMAEDFFSEAVRWAKANNYIVHHESHRKRYLHSPWVTRDLLLKGNQDLADMTMVADLSHWINVAETDCNDLVEKYKMLLIFHFDRGICLHRISPQ